MNWKKAIRTMPVVGRISYALWPSRGPSAPAPVFESSSQYWEDRYKSGGNSGAGSYNRLASFKAEFLNDFVRRHAIETIIEFGCGDGAQLELAQYPSYVGVDVSETILDRIREKFSSNTQFRFIHTTAIDKEHPVDLSLSLDVIYHLVEDATYHAYMHNLFAVSQKYVIVYSSNEEKSWTSPHVRHRRFTDWVDRNAPAFQLIAHFPNRFPYDAENPDNTSFADFFVFEKTAG